MQFRVFSFEKNIALAMTHHFYYEGGLFASHSFFIICNFHFLLFIRCFKMFLNRNVLVNAFQRQTLFVIDFVFFFFLEGRGILSKNRATKCVFWKFTEHSCGYVYSYFSHCVSRTYLSISLR